MYTEFSADMMGVRVRKTDDSQFEGSKLCWKGLTLGKTAAVLDRLFDNDEWEMIKSAVFGTDAEL